VKQRRNANLDVFRALLRAELPAGARTAIDVGCGEGETARILRSFGVPTVVGVDPHGPSIVEARGYGDDIAYVHADVFDVDVEPADVVTAVAMLHHVDMADGLRRLSSLVRTGGRLLVVGLARSTYPRDLWRDVVGSLSTKTHRPWHTTAPIVWQPPVTYADAQRIAESLLPGVRYRRDVRFRYTLAWDRADQTAA